MKRLITIIVIVILMPGVFFSAWLTNSESGLRWIYQQTTPYLPVELSIEKLEGRLLGTITITNMTYQKNGLHIKAEKINLQGSLASFLTAKIELSQLHINSLNIVLPPTQKTEHGHAQIITLPDINLPWHVVLKDGVINDVNILQNDQTFTIDQIRLNASALFSQLDIAELNIKADSFELNIKGELDLNKHYQHKLSTQWQVTLPSTAVIDGKGKLTGNMKMSRLQQRVNGAVNATLNADLHNLTGKLNWLATVDVTDFNVQKLNANWPAIMGNLKLNGKGDLLTANLAGNINGQYPELGLFDATFKLQRLNNNRIQIDQLMLHTPVTDTRIHTRGYWLPGANGGDIRLGLDWKNLRWPLKGNAWFDSATGMAVIEGNLNHYQFELATDRPWSQAPASTWYARAEGNFDGLSFHSLNIHTLNGEVNATGQLNWLDQFSWHAKVSARDINPASLLPQWPGQLNTQLTSTGRIEHGNLIATVDISQLTGKLRGYPVSLSSQLHWHNNGLDISDLKLLSGDSKISIDGRWADELNLHWKIASADLAELYPQAGGKFNARGILRGLQSTPTIQAAFNGQALQLSDYKIGTINGTVAVDVFQWQQLEINLAAQSLELQGYPIQQLEIISDAQQIKTKVVADKITALFKFTGKANAQGWRGQIEQADLDIQLDSQNNNIEIQHWRLKQTADLNISVDTLDSQQLCWSSNNSLLCLLAKRNANEWLLSLHSEQLPLYLLGPWLPEDLKLNGVAHAQANFKMYDHQISGEASIKLPPGELSYPLLDGERRNWPYRDGVFELKLDQQGLKTLSKLTMSNGDQLLLEAELPGFQFLTFDSQQQSLRAEAQLSIHDLGLIEALLPEIQDLQGELAINLLATGTVAQPLFSIKAHLLKGQFRIPRLGLTIDQLSLRSQTDNHRELSFHLAAHSGADPDQGQLVIAGKTLLDRLAGWPTEITIKGEQFEVARIPEAQVQISPDLQVKLNKNIIDIKGKVHIPYAKFQPKDITTAAHVSEDAVMVHNEQILNEKWLITTKIRLTLGDRVHFYGFGFEGRFGGNLLLVDEPGQLTSATGELNIPEGRYRAYGQRLDVEHGRLLYTGGPLTNPGLDMRAIRHIGNITAGINVRGSVTKPQLDIFSIPAMSQTDALAYLVLGRPIENASNEEGEMMAKATLALGISGGDNIVRSLSDRFGLDEMRVESSEHSDQASLVMGRYLTPKLYISYGVGLIESFNTFTVRYQLSDHWQIKSESGEAQGADILYTIER